MDDKEQEIQNKLMQLESSLAESRAELAQAKTSTEIKATPVESEQAKAELCLLAGIALVVTGFLLFLNHVHVTSSLGAFFGLGQGGVGLIVMLLLAGMGMLFYDYKMKLGWVFTAAAAAFLFFTVLSSLQFWFPMTSLLGVILMLLPLAGGAALIARGMAMSEVKKLGNKRGPS